MKTDLLIRGGLMVGGTGNCGFSPFPINPEYLQLHLDLLAGIGDDAMALRWVELVNGEQTQARPGRVLRAL